MHRLLSSSHDRLAKAPARVAHRRRAVSQEARPAPALAPGESSVVGTGSAGRVAREDPTGMQRMPGVQSGTAGISGRHEASAECVRRASWQRLWLLCSFVSALGQSRSRWLLDAHRQRRSGWMAGVSVPVDLASPVGTYPVSSRPVNETAAPVKERLLANRSLRSPRLGYRPRIYLTAWRQLQDSNLQN